MTRGIVAENHGGEQKERAAAGGGGGAPPLVIKENSSCGADVPFFESPVAESARLPSPRSSTVCQTSQRRRRPSPTARRRTLRRTSSTGVRSSRASRSIGR